MHSAADLLEMAESIAGRIPLDDAFSEERQISWELIGRGYLQCMNPEGASRAMRQMPVGHSQAALRIDFANWTSEHPESDLGRQVLRETVDQIAQWNDWFTRSTFGELTRNTHRLLGDSAVRQLADGVDDSFTRTIVLVAWASVHGDAGFRRALLNEAEAGPATESGNRDWSLRTLMRGYQAAGLHTDADRVRSLMERDPETMDAPVSQAEDVIASVNELFPDPRPAPDSAADRLSRFLTYRHNDLKIRWLTEQAAQGGLDDPEIEAVIHQEAFQQVDPHRQSSIHQAPPHLNHLAFAAFFFARSVALSKADEELLAGDSRYSSAVDSVALVMSVTRMFSNFGAVTEFYSQEQVEQGLWFLFGYPYFFSGELMKPALPEETRTACLESMLVPFHDYYQNKQNYGGSAFYMWWGDYNWLKEFEAALPVGRRVLEQILALPDRGCQVAALHGLNHLHPDSESSSIIQDYLERCRSQMTTEEIEYAELCREGKAL